MTSRTISGGNLYGALRLPLLPKWAIAKSDKERPAEYGCKAKMNFQVDDPKVVVFGGTSDILLAR